MGPFDAFKYAPKDVRDAVEKLTATFEACKHEVAKIKNLFDASMKMQAGIMAYQKAAARHNGVSYIVEKHVARLAQLHSTYANLDLPLLKGRDFALQAKLLDFFKTLDELAIKYEMPALLAYRHNVAVAHNKLCLDTSPSIAVAEVLLLIQILEEREQTMARKSRENKDKVSS